MEAAKETALENLPKEDLVKRCKKYLIIAQKAKLAKDESSAELRKCQESEVVLKTEVDNTKRQLSEETLNHKSYIEQSQIKIEQLEKNNAIKTEENKDLKKAFDNLNNKFSEYEILNSTGREKLNEVCLINEKLTENLNNSEAKNLEQSEKLKNVESKYSIVENKLVDFQDKYLEEKQKHSKLEARLLKLEERSDRSSSERSESRNGLQTVNEAQDLEAVCQKMDEAVESNEKSQKRIEELLKQIDLLKQELLISEKSQKQEQRLHDKATDKCIDQLHQLCLEAIAESKIEREPKGNTEKEVDHLDNLSIELKEAKEKINTLTNSKDKFDEMSLINSNLNEEIQKLSTELESCNIKTSENEKQIAIDSKLIESLKEEINNSKVAPDSNQMTQLLNSQNTIENLNKQLKELQNKLESCNIKISEYEKQVAIDSKLIESLKEAINNSKDVSDSNQTEELFKSENKIKNLNKQLTELQNKLESCNIKISEYEKQMAIDSKLIESLKEEMNNLKKVRDSSQMEEVLKSQNIIENLNKQLKELQSENLSADNTISDLQAKFEESTLVSAKLEELVRQRCEEYAQYKAKVEAFDCLVPQFKILGKDVCNASVAFKKLKEDSGRELNNVKQEQQMIHSKVLKVVEEFLGQLNEANSELLSEMNMMNQVDLLHSTINNTDAKMEGKIKENMEVRTSLLLTFH